MSKRDVWSPGYRALSCLALGKNWELFLVLEEAVEQGFYKIPLLVLGDIEETPKRVAARILRGVEEREVLESLVASLSELDPMNVGGGEEMRARRRMPQLEIETTLSGTLGLEVELNRDERVPIEKFKNALGRLAGYSNPSLDDHPIRR